MILKTYGVCGLMDWTTNIKVGKGAVAVHFTGGALTAYGVTPAKYATANPFFQTVIENSEYYKSGRIQLIGEMEVPDNAAATGHTRRQAGSENKGKGGGAGGGKGRGVQEAEAQGQQREQEAEEGKAIVEVADKNEAIEYLKENCNPNYTATQLRGKSAFEAACEECGVKFVFTA